jgi:Na+-driven multidrug efflux pump
LQDSARLDWRQLRIDPKTLKKMLYIGLPASIQGIVGGCSNVLIQSAVNSLGRVTVAANTAAANVVGYIYTAQNSLYHASLTFVGQNFGAGKFKRLRRSVLTCIGTVTALGLVLSSAVILLGESLLSLYLPGNTEAIGIGMYHIWYIGGFYFILGIAEVGCGALRGLGKSLSAMLISLLGTLLGQVVWILTVFRYFPSLRVLYVSYPVCWLITLTVFYVVFFRMVRKLERWKTICE